MLDTVHASQPEVLGGCCLSVHRRGLQSEPGNVMPDITVFTISVTLTHVL